MPEIHGTYFELVSDDPIVARRALIVVRERRHIPGGPADVSAIIANLHSPHREVREEAAECLKAFPGKITESHLTYLLAGSGYAAEAARIVLQYFSDIGALSDKGQNILRHYVPPTA